MYVLDGGFDVAIVIDEALFVIFFFQAEDGIRDLVRSRGLGDVYKRQGRGPAAGRLPSRPGQPGNVRRGNDLLPRQVLYHLSLIHI